MKIKVKISLANDTGNYNPGVIYEVPEQFAKAWLESGHAVPVEEVTEAPAKNEPKVTENEPNDVIDLDDLSDMSYKDLKQLAKDCNIKGYNTMKRKELEKAINKAIDKEA